ncbi:hypothetical protein [Streptomyces collinus]|uniref:hypothetical protein n=1 Tax=Streptomyces collinus TaxID=42684 RepID=UPI003816D701
MTLTIANTGRIAALTGVVFAAAACGSPQPGPRISPPSHTSSATLQPPSRPSPTTRKAVGAAPENLRDTEWPNVPIPGDFCDIPGLIHFKGKQEATASSHTWGTVHIYRSDVVYGDIDGDRRDEAAVHIGCDNGGGTAAGQIAYGAVVFRNVQGQLIALGTVKPQKEPPAVHCTLLAKIVLTASKVTAHEKWYRPTDSNCCPTGTATTVWEVRNDQLVPGVPHILS